jgi:hypothetical protein
MLFNHMYLTCFPMYHYSEHHHMPKHGCYTYQPQNVKIDWWYTKTTCFAFFSILHLIRFFVDINEDERGVFYGFAIVPSYFRPLRISRVRFKPGYIRIWKHAREELQVLLHLTFPYNQRLTLFLLRLRLFLYRQAVAHVTFYTLLLNSIFFLFASDIGLYVNGFLYQYQWAMLVPLIGDYFSFSICIAIYLFFFNQIFHFFFYTYLNAFNYGRLMANALRRKWTSKFVKLFFNCFHFAYYHLLFEDVASLSFFFFKPLSTAYVGEMPHASVWRLYNWKYIN